MARTPAVSARWIVRLAPLTGRFIVAKVRPSRRTPGVVEVIGDNKFDVHDDVCALIREHGGRPPAEPGRGNPYRDAKVLLQPADGGFVVALDVPGLETPAVVSRKFVRRADAARHAGMVCDAFGLEPVDR